MICERALKTGTREAMAVAIYELMQEHELDHADIRSYAFANADVIRQRAINRRLAI